MKKILFVQHGETDKPGLLEESLLAGHIGIDVTHPYLGQPLPASLVAFDGLAVGGGAQGAYEADKYPYLSQECQLIREAAHAGKPVLGLCLGAQLMAAALGAPVRPGDRREIGFFPITLDPIAKYDPLLCDLPTDFVATHWHGDVFDLPAAGMRLASSALTPNQLFRYGCGLYGLQFHLEMTLEIFEEMLAGSDDYLIAAGADPEQLRHDAWRFLPPLRETAEKVFSRWAAML
ncbi:MAG: gamma-glutamyl-gamma-aminobutyrate hydrolase family protein [Terrimicrobiaceae bacterium]